VIVENEEKTPDQQPAEPRAEQAEPEVELAGEATPPEQAEAAQEPQAEAEPEQAAEAPAEEEPAAEAPAQEEPAAEAPAQEEPAAEAPAEEQPATEAPAEEQPAAEEAAQEQPAAEESPEEQPEAPPQEEPAVEETIAPATIDLGAEARYSATGKRKSAIARVTLRPGNGGFELNGRTLDNYFPRATLQAVVRQPLEVVGYVDRIDVRAKIHGGGVSSQAAAVRHGISKALIEADPNLRGELKRRGLLTRDPRVKERKKAGLKKARKRPQFSKR
jgi:small subunit ribosomal protein S9